MNRNRFKQEMDHGARLGKMDPPGRPCGADPEAGHPTHFPQAKITGAGTWAEQGILWARMV